MKRPFVILTMLLLAFSSNITAEEKNCMTVIGYYNMDDPECKEKMMKKLKEQGEKIDKEQKQLMKEIMEKQKQNEIQAKQEKYEATLEQLKRDNPNFKKPLKAKPSEYKNAEELTREDFIEYRQKQKTGNH